MNVSTDKARAIVGRYGYFAVFLICFVYFSLYNRSFCTPGNLRNIVEGSGFVQLIFFVPGIDETLRVGGRGKLSADLELLALMVEFGKPPRAALRIDVSEVYFHCGKALMRSKLWGGTHVERSVMPSIGEVIHDQTGLGERESQDVIYERYKTQL